ncbi:MAG: response regulator transcription factor [Caldilineaceae bacterium]|nr:response regulator transcription factor [Caldilineaceae bacterium]
MSDHAVLIAAADASLRRALKTVLTTRLHMAVVGEACDGDEFYAAAAWLEPAFALLDWSLTGLCCDGDDDACLARLAQTPVVVLTANEEQEAAALEAGAVACFRKGAAPDRLIELIAKLQN